MRAVIHTGKPLRSMAACTWCRNWRPIVALHWFFTVSLHPIFFVVGPIVNSLPWRLRMTQRWARYALTLPLMTVTLWGTPYIQVNLTSDIAGLAANTDPNL